MMTCLAKPIPGKPCKFVKVLGQYRFFPKNAYDTHRDAVAPGEVAEAAGILIAFDDRWVMIDNHSASLNIACQQIHHRELAVLLGQPEADE